MVDVIIGEGVIRWLPPEKCIPMGEAGAGTNDDGREVRLVLALMTGFRTPACDMGVLVKGPNAGELFDTARIGPTPPTLLAATLAAAEAVAAVDPTPLGAECSTVGRRFNPGR